MEGSGCGYREYYLDILLEGLRKTTTNISEVSRCVDRNLNIAPPKCKSDSLPLETSFIIIIIIIIIIGKTILLSCSLP
jgi:hypothetical protein